MKIFSILFYKKFDYVVFPIGFIAFLIIIVDIFYKTNLDASRMWGQLFLIFAYYLLTRGRAEKNFIMKGIEPVIIVTLFGFFVMIGLLANVIILLGLTG